MEESESTSSNTSTLNTEKLSSPVHLENTSKTNSDRQDTKKVGKDANLSAPIRKTDTGNGTGSDSDGSKDEDITFKPDALAAATAQLAAETSQSNLTKLLEATKAQDTENMQDETEIELEPNNVKQLSDDVNKIELKRSGVGGAEDEDPLVIDEAGDEDTKSESDMAGESEVKIFD